jgi:hypothetical protein
MASPEPPVPLHPTRVGHQQFLVKRANVVVFQTRIAERVESAERGLAGNVAKNKTQVAAGCARGAATRVNFD